jgi:hypothetical protein
MYEAKHGTPRELTMIDVYGVECDGYKSKGGKSVAGIVKLGSLTMGIGMYGSRVDGGSI